MLFEPHGDIRFSTDGRLHLVEVRGPWNAELIDAYRRSSTATVHDFAAAGPWAAIIVTRGSTMFTDDAEAELRAMLTDPGRTLNRVAACYVIGPEVEGYRLCDGILRNVYEPTSPFEIFDSLPPARAWCERLIAAARNAGVTGAL
ncbi:MAG TPA: hypothetical protein VGV37_07835 [Aliidongia sp.]|uniref:hypothetical protein n=1 Tax=Aliidongia sp. TaxID=1914230 RepID=UPI002DDDB848|nr:hypothetical protein [Aliidongia sp.]HEV2674436.1 hypothetical protein [Aliidongia sp.]